MTTYLFSFVSEQGLIARDGSSDEALPARGLSFDGVWSAEVESLGIDINGDGRVSLCERGLMCGRLLTSFWLT